MQTGLYIGRFQPFHLGHLSAIHQALEIVDRLLIAIGSTQYDNESGNPLTVEERYQIIEQVLADEGLQGKCEIFMVPDIHSNEEWTNHVREIVPEFEMVFVGNNGLVKELFEKDKTRVEMVEHRLDISATKIRRTVLEDDRWQQWVTPKTAELLGKMDFENRVKRLES